MRGSRWVPFLTAFLLLPLTSACGPDGSRSDSADAFVTRDSAGITIVKSSAPVWRDRSAWRLSSEPVLRIGSVDGRPEEQLFMVTAAFRLVDGQILVANSGSHEIRWYGPDGRPVRSAGKEGGGPGEFRRIASMFPLPCDSLLVWDTGARRVSIFDAEGSFVRSFQLPELELPRTSTLRGALADGRLLIGSDVVFGADAREGALRDTLLLMLHQRGSSNLDTVWVGFGTEYFVSLREGGLTVTGIPFGRSTHTAIAGDRLLIGDNDRYEMRTVSPEGRVERILRRAHTPIRVQTRHFEEVKAERLERAVDESFRQRFEPLFERMPMMATFPAFATFRVSASGHLWVRSYPIPGTEPRREVFDPDGRLLGPIAAPTGFRPLDIGEDYVLGVRRDDLDVEYVELYAIEKPDGNRTAM